MRAGRAHRGRLRVWRNRAMLQEMMKKTIRASRMTMKKIRQKIMTIPSSLRKTVLKTETLMWRKIQMKKDKRTQRM